MKTENEIISLMDELKAKLNWLRGKPVDLNNANELYTVIENELYMYGIFRLLRWA